MKFLSILLYIAAISLALIIEATFFSSLNPFGAMPDLVLIITVCTTFFLPKPTALAAAALAGFLEDLYIGQMIGTNILILLALVYLITTFASRIIQENLITPLLIIFASSLASYVLGAVVLLFADKAYLLNLAYLNSMFFGSLFNLVLSIVLYPLIYLIFHGIRKGEAS